MTVPDMVNIRVDAFETALAAQTQPQTNPQTFSLTPGTHIHVRLTSQDTRLDDIHNDHQVIIDSLDNLHTKITETENEETTQPDQLTNLTTSIAQT